MGVDLEKAVVLMKERAQEYGLYLFLLYTLEADIAARRMLEKMGKVPFSEKRSVEVERQRELTQQRISTLEAELDSFATLIERIVRNETDARP